MRKGPLSKADKAYIEKRAGKDNAIKIAKKLDRNVELVEKHISTIVVEAPEPAVEAPASDQPQMPKVMDVIARRPERGVVVMTEAASMACDKLREQRPAKQPSSRYKNCIHKFWE
jgi:uncharacterized membrane protein